MRTQVSIKSYNDVLKAALEVTNKHPSIETLEAYDALLVIICDHMERVFKNMKGNPLELIVKYSEDLRISIEEDDDNYYYRIVTPVGDSPDTIFSKTRIVLENGDIEWSSETVGMHGTPGDVMIH